MPGPRRYIVTCHHCGAKTGTNPPGLDPPTPPGLPEPKPGTLDHVDCVQCGMKVSRKGGQHIRAKEQNPQEEFDLLKVE